MQGKEERRAHRKRERVISWADSVGRDLLVLPSSVLTSLSSARGAPASSIASRAWKAAALVRSCGDSLAWAWEGGKGKQMGEMVGRPRKRAPPLGPRYLVFFLRTSKRNLSRSMMPSRASCRKRVSSSWEGKGANT